MQTRKTDLAIAAYDVQKRYSGVKDRPALNGFHLEVPSGSVCGLLGPNGAGKTTAVKILSTLLAYDEGQANVAGFDVKAQAHHVRAHIGVVSQYASVDEILTARQNLMLFAQLNHLPRRQAMLRTDELLEQFALTGTGKMPVRHFSGGMRRRLDLAASLIVSPSVLFVDEPTTGLDPAGRQEVWMALRALIANGTTILLTTQYLEEADQLAQQICMMKEGRVIAQGSPDDLKAALGGDRLELILRPGVDVHTVEQRVRGIASSDVHIDAESRLVSIPILDRTRGFIAVARVLSEAEIELEDITLRRPTLDEVFFHFVGSTEAASSSEATL